MAHNPKQPVPDGMSRAIEHAAAILRAGGLVALPTETVYGLAADATQPEAVAKIFAVKGRPEFNPVICHITGRNAAEKLVDISPLADLLIDAFWPGPLTLVLAKLPDAPVADLVTAGLDTLAVRAPAHSVARQLLYAVDRPLAAPSANKSGHVSPTTADHVRRELGDDVDMVLDGGPCGIGLESTIVGISDDEMILLRPGSITAEDLEEATGVRPKAKEDATITAPGQLKSHYAPGLPMRLNARRKQAGEFMIGFGQVGGEISLSESSSLVEAAANLFAHLRTADSSGAKRIAIAPIPAQGLGIAINDRLRRAAAPKDDKQ